jgi:hypothetical protein
LSYVVPEAGDEVFEPLLEPEEDVPKPEEDVPKPEEALPDPLLGPGDEVPGAFGSVVGPPLVAGCFPPPAGLPGGATVRVTVLPSGPVPVIFGTGFPGAVDLDGDGDCEPATPWTVPP